MKRAALALLVSCSVAGLGCASDALPGDNPNAPLPDLGVAPPPPDLASPPPPADLTTTPILNACGDTNDTCEEQRLMPPFPLPTDPMVDPAARASGLGRDTMGYLILATTVTGGSADSVWIANTQDLTSGGTVSRMDSKTVREVGRYLSVTCASNQAGSAAMCDGKSGCCAIDDWQNYQARKAKQPPVPLQAVQRASNSPGAVAVDLNGDALVANRAFGGQSSVTKIAASVADCIDRNRDGRIQTSSDRSGNGFIEIDCNGDGAPDDLLGVKQKPCLNGLPQEFFGLDDECILWTTNTFASNATGRALTLVPNESGPSDAWAGGYTSGQFVRIDGATGRMKDDAQLSNACYAGTGAFAAVTDASGIVWVSPLGGGKLCYFNSKNPANVGVVRDPQFGQAQGFGITMDRDQNVWLGMSVARYEPDRSNGFANLGNGVWTRVVDATGIGISADARSGNAHFVWSCNGGHVLQIPASKIKPSKADQSISSAGWPTFEAPCFGVGVDARLQVWPSTSGTTTRTIVDKLGGITQPVIDGMPAGNNKCPAGDSCPIPGGGEIYGDFTGYGLRSFTAQRGNYGYVFRSACLDNSAAKGTRWLSLDWDADVPQGAQLSVRVRAGSVPVPDRTWSAWSAGASASPVDLSGLPAEDGYMEVELDFVASAKGLSPTLKAVRVLDECIL